MSERPVLPSTAELKRAEEAVSGGAVKIFELYCQAFENYERRLDEIMAQEAKQSSHLRTYRYFSVLSGVLLAAASLALCAYGIEQKTNLMPLAGVLAPVTTLAGVFVWGYRPNKNDSTKKQKTTLNSSQQLSLAAEASGQD